MDFNNNSYNLDELDHALSDPRHQAAAVAGPATDGRRTAPGTRRGSLVPNISASSAAGLAYTSGVADANDPTAAESGTGASRRKKRRGAQYQELNLFTFGVKELTCDIFLVEGEGGGGGESCVSYHEYAVFSPSNPNDEVRSPSIMSEGEEGLRIARNALRFGHGLDYEVSSCMYFYVFRPV
jgi:hypothetical protein